MEAARAEREQTLSQARAEADRLRKEAQQLKDGAHVAGHREGLEAGRADAHAAAFAQMEKQVADLIDAIGRITRDALAERHKRIEHMEPELVLLATEIAEKILAQELKSHPDVVASIARTCIGRVRDRQEIVIHANTADMETLQRYRDQFIRLEDLGSLRIVEDSRVGPGGILLETQAGEIDARMEMQLDRIRQEFQGVSESREPRDRDRPQ